MKCPVPAGDVGAEPRIGLKHGGGGPAMRSLIRRLFVPGVTNGGAKGTGVVVGLSAMDDGAVIAVGDRFLVMTTDSHVVQPIRFPGGDIGRLAVAGTINDLAMMGATEPVALTCAVIVEEGFSVAELEVIAESLRATCAEVGVEIVTGDTKVMGRGEVDGIVINTTGIGWATRVVRDCGLELGDRLIVTGSLGDHGFAVLAARQGFSVDGDLRSDVAPLHDLIRCVLAVGSADVTAMKDPTRGGLSSALHEMAEKSGVGIVIEEGRLPVKAAVRAVSELLGIDPLHVANEGKAVIGVRAERADAVLDAIRAHPLGRDAAIIGTCVSERPGSLIVDTGFGRRLLSELDGEPLPRIC